MTNEKYGKMPKMIGVIPIAVTEMMFYQYLPIKTPESHGVHVEDRLTVFNPLIKEALSDFIAEFGWDRFYESYVYITAKNLFQSPQKGSFNRPGWHSDGFLTDDINYVWSDSSPTVFNRSLFNLTPDHKISLQEMEEQANEMFNIRFIDNSLLRLDQYVIHRVAEVRECQVRAFVKISVSKEPYNLIGNSINHQLKYNFDMKPRSLHRNHPTK